MTTATVTTSVQAYELARKLVGEYDVRKRREKEMNVKKEAKKKQEDDAAKSGEGPSRTVTQIDYGKHERTIKELDRQEKEERFQRKKEEASQWCTLDHEHGPNCRRPIGGCSHDHQKEWAIYEKSTEEKIKAADRFREEGNEAYRKHNYGLAAVHYRKALLQFDYTFPEGEEEEKQVDAVKVPCLLNLAACKCQQEQWDEVLTHCRLALEINPRSVKAYYRTGLAHLARDNFDEAREALMTAHEIEPKNAEVLGALKRLKETMANYKVRRKEVFREMVAGGAGAEDEGEAEPAAAQAPEAAPRVAEPPEAMPPDSATDASSLGADAGAAHEVAALAAEASDAAADTAGPPRSEGRRPGDPTALAAAEADAASGLRQRRPPAEADRVAKDEEEEDDDAGADEALSPVQRRLLNRLLVGAAALAVTSIAVCATAALLAPGGRA